VLERKGMKLKGNFMKQNKNFFVQKCPNNEEWYYDESVKNQKPFNILSEKYTGAIRDTEKYKKNINQGTVKDELVFGGE